MRRHLIAGAFACFSSSLFGQTTTNPANQPQRLLNNAQNTLQSGLQSIQNSLNQTVPRNANNTVLDNGRNRSSLNAQGPDQTQYSNNESLQNSVRMQNQQSMQFENKISNENMRQPSPLQNNGMAHTLRKDVNGREFICVNGRSVYFDNDDMSAQGNTETGIQHRAGYGNYDLQNGQNPLLQSTPANPFDEQQSTLKGNGNIDDPQSTQYQVQPMPVYQSQPSYSQSNEKVHTLRTDANGREFICVNGRPVYFDNTSSASARSNSTLQNQYRTGNGNGEPQKNQNWAPSKPTGEQSAVNQQPPGSIQSSVDDPRDSRNADTTGERKPIDGLNDQSPSVDRLDRQKQNESKENSSDSKPKTELDKGPDAIVPSDSPSKKDDKPKS